MYHSSPKNIVNIPTLKHFGKIYTIEFSGVKFNMVQHKCFSLVPDIMTTNSSENAPAPSTPPGTNNLFSTTLQYHTHPPCTGQWDMTSNQKLDISSLLRWIIYISLCGEKFVNLRDFHIYLSIPLNATANKNIEVIPPFLDL